MILDIQSHPKSDESHPAVAPQDAGNGEVLGA
jgi:hypothetical protein